MMPRSTAGILACVFAVASVGGPLTACSDADKTQTAPSVAARRTQTLRFCALGHLRGMVPNHADALMALADAVNAEAPDYVFLLGDYTAEGSLSDWKIVERFLARIEAPVISAPGNHEVTQPPRFRPLRSYLARFGYTYYSLVTDHANFITINSSDRFVALRDYLELKLAELDLSKPTFLLCHHQLWDPNAVWHDRQKEFWVADYRPEDQFWLKPYTPDQILPLLEGKVDAVIAGDITRQYDPLEVRGMTMYPVGIGSPGRNDPLLFFIGDVTAKGELIMTRRDVELAPDDPWYVGR